MPDVTIGVHPCDAKPGLRAKATEWCSKGFAGVMKVKNDKGAIVPVVDVEPLVFNLILLDINDDYFSFSSYLESCIFDYCEQREIACDSILDFEKEHVRAVKYLITYFAYFHDMFMLLCSVGPTPSIVDECGVCYGDGSSCGKVCYASGDPHYSSFDGHKYDYD